MRLRQAVTEDRGRRWHPADGIPPISLSALVSLPMATAVPGNLEDVRLRGIAAR